MFIANAPDLDLLTRILVLGPIALVIVLAATKIVGLRTFSKMTAFDFVTTVAIGSLLAGAAAATKWPAFIQNTGGVMALLLVQACLALIRKRSAAVQSAMSNQPVFLMREGKWHVEALKQTRVSKSDVRAKLREANACELSRVRAVVLESTGDISVLHADCLDETLLRDVRSVGDTRQAVDTTR